MTEENDKMNSHPAPQHRLADLREWLLDRIDGGEEMRGEDGLVSNFIRQIDAQNAELADLKQRLLPQFQGRAQRAEHERDALLEQLIEARSAIQRAYGCLWRYTGSSNPMFLQARKMLLARLTKEQQAIGIRYANEIFGPTTEHEILHSGCSHDAAPSATAVDHGYDRTASLAEGHYVCLCGGACSRPDASRPSPTTKEQP